MNEKVKTQHFVADYEMFKPKVIGAVRDLIIPVRDQFGIRSDRFTSDSELTGILEHERLQLLYTIHQFNILFNGDTSNLVPYTESSDKVVWVHQPPELRFVFASSGNFYSDIILETTEDARRQWHIQHYTERAIYDHNNELIYGLNMSFPWDYFGIKIGEEPTCIAEIDARNREYKRSVRERQQIP